MSVRSTMDLGLAALTAPSESSSVVGVVAAVGAAVVGLAAVTSAQKAVAEQISTLPALRLEPQAMADARELARQSWRGAPPVRARSRTRTRAAIHLINQSDLDAAAVPAAQARWEEALKGGEGVGVFADALLEQGDPMGEAIALYSATEPFLNMETENECSGYLNDTFADATPAGAVWHETACALHFPMAMGAAAQDWLLRDAIHGPGPEVAAILDRYGYDGEQILETYGGKTISDFLDRDLSPRGQEECIYTNPHMATEYEVLVYSKGPLPKKGE